MSKRYHRDVWVGLFLFLCCIAILFNAVKISGQAAYLPVTLTILMALCAVCIMIKGVRLTKEQGGEYNYPLTVKDSKYAFLFMLFIFIHYLGFRYITYWIATPIFMIFTQKYLKLKSIKINLLITVVYTVLAYVVFVIILHLPIYKIGILGRFFRYL